MWTKELPPNLEDCLVCGAKNAPHSTGHDYLYHTTEQPFSIVKCLTRSAEQLSPLPEQNQIISFYPPNYYSYVTGDNKQPKGFFVNLRERIVEISYAPNVRRNALWLLASMMKRNFRGLPLSYSANRTFLDVGCGDGYNMNLLAKHGWTVSGFEIGQTARKENIQYKNSLEAVDFNAEGFDYIRVWHVLEHVSDPHRFIEKNASLLSSDGMAVFALPNTESWYAKLFGRYWYNRDIPRHLINYSPRSLTSLLRQHDLKITELRFQAAGGFLGSLQHLFNDRFSLRLNLINIIPLVLFFYPLDILSNITRQGDVIFLQVSRADACSK